MASLCLFGEAAEEALFHTEEVMALLCHKAGVASHSPKTAAEDTHHCTVAGAGGVEAAVFVHNMPHRGPCLITTAGKL